MDTPGSSWVKRRHILFIIIARRIPLYTLCRFPVGIADDRSHSVYFSFKPCSGLSMNSFTLSLSVFAVDFFAFIVRFTASMTFLERLSVC